MKFFLEIGAYNAVIASILAIVVFCVSRTWRNPVAAHILWTLVLLKLLTPPIWRPSILFEPQVTVISEKFGTEHHNILSDRSHDLDVTTAPVHGSGVTTVDRQSSDANRFVRWVRSKRLGFWVGTAWLLGSTVFAWVTIQRAHRFHVLLGDCLDAPVKIQNTVREVAGLFGLGKAPTVHVVAASISPFVWPVGLTSKLVLPSRCIKQLSEPEVRTIIAHEIAHLARHDHWGRWLQTVATVVYWWHPVTWWARRELLRSEELCCDVLVLRTLEDSVRDYSEALIRSVTLAPAHAAKRSVLALGFGHSICLKRRIEMMLMHFETARLSYLAKLALIAAAIVTLAVGPRMLAVAKHPSQAETAQAIITAWMNRQDAVRNVTAVVKSNVVLKKGCLPLRKGYGPGQPLQDHEYSQVDRLFIAEDGSRRHEREGGSYHTDVQRVIQREEITCVLPDGPSRSYMHIPETNVQQGMIGYHEPGMLLGYPQSFPLMWYVEPFGWTAKRIGISKPSDIRILTDESATRKGLIVIGSTRERRKDIRLWLDPQRGFLLVRAKLNGSHGQEYSIEYATDESGTHIPKQWNYRSRWPDGRVRRTSSSRLDEVDLDATLGGNTFDVEFPDGTMVFETDGVQVDHPLKELEK